MYRVVIRPILFLFQPETIHHFVFTCLRASKWIPFMQSIIRRVYQIRDPRLEKEVFGIRFPNPVGLAAGMDKDAEAFDVLGNMGFGFVEIGTITPKPQPGNPKPRVFRLRRDSALINRMGFNNAGVDASVERLKRKRTNVIIGGNIGKNKITPNSEAVNDYLTSFHKLHAYVDYFVVNVSSPNTPDLRALQDKEPLKKLLSALKEANATFPKTKPILLKIAPDLSNDQLNDIVEIVHETAIDGIVATNTTISRDGLSYSAQEIKAFGAGGLSGKVLSRRSTEVIRYLRKQSGDSIPIIAVGGIFTPQDAIEKLNAGASLVQLYTGFVYEGPNLIKAINQALLKA